MRMPVVVVQADRDDSHRWPHGGQEGGRGPRIRAVVAHLEHVHRAQRAAFGEQLLHGRLGVPGEQGPEAAEAEHEHDRGVVDIVHRRRTGHVPR